MRIATVTMEMGLLIRRQPCGTAVYEWIKAWFIYSIIRYPACLWNQGVRIIKALLYIRMVPTRSSQGPVYLSYSILLLCFDWC